MHCSFIPVIYPPPVSQSLDWVLMTVAAGHLGRPQSQLGGSVSPTRYPLSAPSPAYSPAQFGSSPHPVWLRAALKHRGCTLACPLRTTHPPVLFHAEVRSPHSPLLCSLFVQGQSNPSSCRLNLHTKDQCKDHQLCGCKSRVHSRTTHPRPLLKPVCT